MIKSFRDLRVWTASLKLSREIHKVTRLFPASEQFGLTNQLRRASVSIPSNIAEGFERHAPREFARFLFIAKGSLAEVEIQVEIGHAEGSIGDSDYARFIDECQCLARQLSSLVASVCERGDRVSEGQDPYGLADDFGHDLPTTND